MISAGPERDKRIAELKGRCLHKNTENYQEFGMEIIHYIRCLDCRDSNVSLYEKQKPYSTDITCAMGLWDEMAKAGLMPVIKTIWIDHGELGYRVSCEGGHFMHEAWDMADAISGAWLKWKESK